MAASSDNTLLIANEEVELPIDLDDSEGHNAKEHESLIKEIVIRLYPFVKLLRLWWKTLIIILTPLILLLLLKFVDTRVSSFICTVCVKVK